MEKKLTIVNLEDLVEWKKNPRDMDDAGKDRLKAQLLRLGQYKPLIVTEDEGFNVILGGNMRTRALRELVAEGHERFKKIWISKLEFTKEKGNWYAHIDGVKQGQNVDGTYDSFESKEAAMFEYSLSDNGREGFYMEDELVAQARGFKGVDMSMYHVDTAYTTGLDDMIGRYDMADIRARGGGKEGADRSTVKDKKVSYDNATIKQIVLYYPTAEYEDMLAFLQTIEDENEEVQSNTEAIDFLRKFYEDNQPKS